MENGYYMVELWENGYYMVELCEISYLSQGSALALQCMG